MSDFALASYDYSLPEACIAAYAHEPADEARLLVYDRAKDQISDHLFVDLPEILPKDCAMVFNDTKVFKARIFGHKSTGGAIELFINKILANDEFIVQIKGRIKQGALLYFQQGLSAKVLSVLDDGCKKVCFYINDQIASTNEVLQILESIGHVPLPPYIKRSDTKEDERSYQSIFAEYVGAVAAPTASLHFTPRLINQLAPRPIHKLTLHVGAGTFAGVNVSDIRQHIMHQEVFNIPPDTIKLINSQTPIVGVGTTVTRSIEYYVRTNLSCGECDLFLHPGNKPKRLDYLITNFHLPKSTLIMLVASFIGRMKTLDIYNYAIRNGYKFYSYGDGMLIL